MVHKSGGVTISQRCQGITDILSVVPHASIPALTRRHICSESSIRNALNFMLSQGMVIRRKEYSYEVLFRKGTRRHGFSTKEIARPQWIYMLLEGYKNGQLELFPHTANLTIIPDSSGLTEHP